MPTEAERNLAERLLECSDRARLIANDDREPGLAMEAAERVQRTIRERRVAQGEQVVGYKIGFTNRRAWSSYRIDAPIWGPVYSRGTERLETPRIRVDPVRYIQPRFEPEIVLGIARVPTGDDPQDLAEAIGWVAHGIEVVQSIYPDWRFSAAEGVAAQALHAALYVGPEIAPGDAGTLAERLAGIRLVLERRDDPSSAWVEVASGVGADVLDGPLTALGHLVRGLRERGQRLAAGELVSTGTLVNPQALLTGQHWRTRVEGMSGLENLTIDVT